MLMAEYSYETDIEVQREEACAKMEIPYKEYLNLKERA